MRLVDVEAARELCPVSPPPSCATSPPRRIAIRPLVKNSRGYTCAARRGNVSAQMGKLTMDKAACKQPATSQERGFIHGTHQ